MEEMKNPWRTLEKKLVYSNPWIIVEEHQVINPSGNPGIYGKVGFKNKAVGIIPLDKDMNTWLVGQYRYTLNEYSWEIPMGGGPLGQNVEETAYRELLEETGLSAKKLTKILRIHTSNSVTDEEGFVFLAEDLTSGQPHMDETEELELLKLPLMEAVTKALNGEITDAISIAGLLKAATIYRIL